MPPLFSSRPLLPEKAAEGNGRKLEVNVVFTTFESTLAALKTARALAQDLDAQIRLLVTQVVPFLLPLDNPPVCIGFVEWRLRALESQAGVQPRVEIYLCRDRRQTLLDFTSAGSLLVIGGARCWWPTREKRLARWLEAKDRQVILAAPIEEGENKTVSEKHFRMPSSSH